MLPDAFFASDGLSETHLTVLDGFGAYPAVIDKEVDKYLPFVSTTKILMAAVRAGMGREQAHEVIKEHAVKLALEMREQGGGKSLSERLANDSKFPLTEEQIKEVISNPLNLTGLSSEQVETFVQEVEDLASQHPEAAQYSPRQIL